MSTRPKGTGHGRPKTTVLTLAETHRRRGPITMLTAYDYPTARAVDEAGIDAILVGDSLAMVVLGHPNTLAVGMDEMLHHARAVSRGAHAALLIGDMPFMSYQADAVEAVRNAGRFLQEAGMSRRRADRVRRHPGRPGGGEVDADRRAPSTGRSPRAPGAASGWRCAIWPSSHRRPPPSPKWRDGCLAVRAPPAGANELHRYSVLAGGESRSRE